MFHFLRIPAASYHRSPPAHLALEWLNDWHERLHHLADKNLIALTFDFSVGKCSEHFAFSGPSFPIAAIQTDIVAAMKKLSQTPENTALLSAIDLHITAHLHSLVTDRPWPPMRRARWTPTTYELDVQIEQHHAPLPATDVTPMSAGAHQIFFFTMRPYDPVPGASTQLTWTRSARQNEFTPGISFLPDVVKQNFANLIENSHLLSPREAQQFSADLQQ